MAFIRVKQGVGGQAYQLGEQSVWDKGIIIGIRPIQLKSWASEDLERELLDQKRNDSLVHLRS